jgi:hypothetical protein
MVDYGLEHYVSLACASYVLRLKNLKISEVMNGQVCQRSLLESSSYA